VTAAAGDSTLARIIHAVEEAQGRACADTAICRSVRKRLYPGGLCHRVGRGHPAAAILGGDWFAWIYKALVLLVIACPCALVISTPVTIVSGLAAAARQGILIKGGVYLEEGRKLVAGVGQDRHHHPRQAGADRLSQLLNGAMRRSSQSGRQPGQPLGPPVSRAVSPRGQARWHRTARGAGL
jgi:Cd2+/Zn2+-exporting ATPase